MNSASKSRVLVVDDDPAMRDMVATHLIRHGYPVASCASAAEALAVPNESIDVVVTDMRMPDQDGLVLCRALQARMHAVPVILTTAFGSMDTAIAALRAGAFDFLPKPFRIDALIDVIERANGQRQPDDPLCSLAELERRHVARVLERVGGNKAAAARILGIERKTLYRMLDRWSVLGGKRDKARAAPECARAIEDPH